MKDTILVEDAGGKICPMISTLVINVFMVLIREKIFGNMQKVRKKRVKYKDVIEANKEEAERMTNEEAKEMTIGVAIAHLEDLQRMYLGNEKFKADVKALDVAIKAVKQKAVLDSIKAEILDEAEYAYADFDRYKEDILHAESDELPDDDFRYGMKRAVEIIDKYKAVGRIANEKH